MPSPPRVSPPHHAKENRYFPSGGQGPNPAPILRTAPSPFGIVLRCARSPHPPPVRAERPVGAVGLCAVTYACAGSPPTEFPQGDSGLEGASGYFRRRELRGRASGFSAAGGVSDA